MPFCSASDGDQEESLSLSDEITIERTDKSRIKHLIPEDIASKHINNVRTSFK